MTNDQTDASGRPKDIHELEEECRRLIDVREGISREIAACRARFGQSTRRREDQINKLQEEYNRVQHRILEVDKQIRSAHTTCSHTTCQEILVNNNTSPIELSRAWLEAKSNEEAARDRRITVEEELIKQLGVKPEGSKTHDLSEFKVTVTGVINRTLDKVV